jgi:hypothetical protein
MGRLLSNGLGKGKQARLVSDVNAAVYEGNEFIA